MCYRKKRLCVWEKEEVVNNSSTSMDIHKVLMIFIARHNQGQRSPTSSLADLYWAAAIVVIVYCLDIQALCKLGYYIRQQI